MNRNLFISIAAAALLALAACSSGTGVGQLGEACGPTRGCADGLTCHEGACVAISGDGDGGLSPGDAGNPSSADLGDGGVSDGSSAGDAGSCGACTTPPDACHAKVGTCQAGRCSYAFVDGAQCDDGNPCTDGDTCTSGGCFGTPKVCATPPGSVCLSASQLKTYDQEGACNGGLCVYASHTVTCSGGPCTGGACQSDPCSGVSCNAPPSVCYGSAGTCAAGSCSYPYADGAKCDDGNACTTGDQCNTGACKGVPMACDSPPANVCDNASTLRVYSASGSCSAGSCSYSYGFVSCAKGCSGGQCTPSGWMSETSNTNQRLLGVWGASASSVWAVGQSGTAVYYNGANWQVRSVPAEAQNAYLVAVHGTAANNVFALGSDVLIHFDGTQWKFVASLVGTTCTAATGLYATGDANNDVDISCWYYPNTGADDAYVQLYQVSGAGKVTQLTSVSDGVFGCHYYSGGVWAFSPTNVWLGGCSTRTFDGSALSVVGTATRATEIWAASPQAVFTLDYENYMSAVPELWNGTAWAPLSTGFNGSLSGISGTSASRVFFSGFDESAVGAILYYDGVGFTRATLPTGIGDLNAIWAAPTGEVFAVGDGGAILEGP